MKTAIKKLYASLAMTLSRLVKPSSAARPIDLALARVRILPGDTLVITCDRFLLKEQVEQIKGSVAAALPGAKVMVLHGGLQASAVLAQG